uniref:Transport permease protein n=1 Tax=Streptomyces sp. MJ635-86F5 TaxID=1321967 RepID=X5IYY9_9ACTN|nr:ABC transporter [Streptomyces sp. MJ635-86F5]
MSMTAPRALVHGADAYVRRSRTRKALSDTLVLTRRNLTHAVRQPAELVIALMVPVMLLLLFGYAFNGAMQVPDNGNYREFLVAGIFVMVMTYGIAGAAQGMAKDTEEAVFGRFRSMPMSPSALLVSRMISEMARAVVETAVVAGIGLLMGWRWHGSTAETLEAFGLLLLLRLALVWVGLVLGLLVPAILVTAIVYPLALPLTFISSMFVAPSSMTGWLGTAAEWNPLSSVVNAARELFGNPGVGGNSWIAEHAELMAVVWPLALIALLIPFAARLLRKSAG